jgi:hypothetical protein
MAVKKATFQKFGGTYWKFRGAYFAKRATKLFSGAANFPLPLSRCAVSLAK